MKHTPTPWVVNSCGYIGTAPKFEKDTSWTLVACPPELHGETPHVQLPKPDEQQANAEFICRAVNSHDALLAACKFALDFLDSPAMTEREVSWDVVRDAAKLRAVECRAAIAQAAGNAIQAPQVSGNLNQPLTK